MLEESFNSVGFEYDAVQLSTCAHAIFDHFNTSRNGKLARDEFANLTYVILFFTLLTNEYV